MKTIGIISEYNPFHYGHKFHIEKTKELTGSNYVVAIMSGNFVQRGEPAIIDKYIRAERAIKCGVDLVIELPFIYATSSAERFAKGAVSILEELSVIDFLSFGTESDSLDNLKELAHINHKYKHEIIQSFKKQLEKGLSYAAAKSLALKEFTELSASKPNDILALSYLISMIEIQSKMIPISVKRSGSDYLDDELKPFSSALAIRKALNNKKEIREFLPYEMGNDFDNPVRLNDFSDMIIANLYNQKLTDINLCSEGIDKLINNNLPTTEDILSLLKNIKSKRYPMARLKRLLIHSLMGLTKSKFSRLYGVTYLKVLALNKKGTLILNKIKKNSDIDIVTSAADCYSEDIRVKQSLDIDIKATNIYRYISRGKYTKNDYTRNLLIK